MRRLAVVAAVLIVLAGCSSGDDLPSASSATTTATPSVPTVPGPTVRAGTGNAFCEFLRTYNDRFSRFNAGLAEPQQLRTTMNEAATAIREAENTAPAEVKTDLGIMRGGFESLIRALEAVNFDFARLRLDSLTILQDQNFLAASKRIDDYSRVNCL